MIAGYLQPDTVCVLELSTENALADLVAGRVKALVATSALGMGFDATLGFVVNLVFVPPVALDPAQRSVEALGVEVAASLDRLGEGLASPRTAAQLDELETAVKEIERVGKNKYIMVESYRNELEQFNLQCWALTAESFFDTAEWIWLYDHFGYTGDYEFIYFE